MGLRASRVTVNGLPGQREPRGQWREASWLTPRGQSQQGAKSWPSQEWRSCSPSSAATGDLLHRTQPFGHVFFFKKPLGSEPRHLLVRASANTDLDLSPWGTSKSPSCPALRNNLCPYYPSCLIQSLKRAVSPPSAARATFLPPKPVLQSTSTAGALFKGCQGHKQTFLFTILQESQCPSLLPRQNSDAFQSLHLFF